MLLPPQLPVVAPIADAVDQPEHATRPEIAARQRRRAEEAEARADELAERLKYAEKLLAGREVTA